MNKRNNEFYMFCQLISNYLGYSEYPLYTSDIFDNYCFEILKGFINSISRNRYQCRAV